MSNPISGGSITKDYTWTQEIFALQVFYKFKEVTSSKELSIKFTKNHVKVVVKGEVLVDKDLQRNCDVGESYWQLEDKKELILNIGKTCGEWWKCVYKGDPEVDITKIESPQTDMSSLSDEARTTVEQMIYKQNAKVSKDPKWDDRIRQMKIAKLKKMHPNVDFSNMDLSNAQFNF